MSKLRQGIEDCINNLKKCPVDTFLSKDWKKLINEFLSNCKKEHQDMLALSMSGKINLPARYGYSIIDMALGIAPVTTGQAIVFFEIVNLIHEYSQKQERKGLL